MVQARQRQPDAGNRQDAHHANRHEGDRNASDLLAKHAPFGLDQVGQGEDVIGQRFQCRPPSISLAMTNPTPKAATTEVSG